MSQAPVIICGAGPVGLTTSILLSRLGIPVRLVERRADVSTLPRSRGIMSRTVEIWSQFGLYDEMTAFSLPPHWCERFVYLESLAGEVIGTMSSNCMAPGAQAAATAYDFRCAAQDQIDSMLYRHALTYPSAELSFSTELIEHRQDIDGVSVTLKHADGRLEEARTQWLVAADGGRSPLRERAGITSSGPTVIRWAVNNHFSADLSRWTGGREGTLIWTFANGKIGCFQPLDGKKRWMAQIMIDPAVDPIESWTPDRVVRQLRDMIGDPAAESVDFELHSTYPYAIAATVADRLRDGRLLLVGDAAHRIPPAGGFGMNTGIQTAHNLAWKLAAVVRGDATAALLDSFDVERREVAARACNFGRINAGYIAALERARSRDEQRAAVAASRQFGNWSGLDLGVHYETAGAFVPDDQPAPAVADPVIEYVACAKPGWRAPHLWLQYEGRRISTIDLFEREFVLLTGADGAGWLQAARDSALPLRIRAIEISIKGDAVPEGDFAALYGIGESGAVLVRPDGHVAWRAGTHASDPARELSAALRTVLCLSEPSRTPA